MKMQYYVLVRVLAKLHIKGNKYHEIVNEFYALAGNGHLNKMHFKVNNGGETNSPGTRMTTEKEQGDGNVGIGFQTKRTFQLYISYIWLVITLMLITFSYNQKKLVLD